MMQQQRKRAAPTAKPQAAPKRAKGQGDDDDCVSLASLLRSRPQHRASEPRAQQKEKVQGKGSEQGEVVFELAARRRVTARRWKSTKLVDVREFYDDHGTAKPGKKGISLSLDQWTALKKVLPDVSEAIELVEDDRVGDSEAVAKLTDPMIGATAGDDRSIAFELSAKRRVTVRTFRNAVLIDIREYYEKDGKMLPGNKGISLSKTQWIALQELESDITEAVNQL